MHCEGCEARWCHGWSEALPLEATIGREIGRIVGVVADLPTALGERGCSVCGVEHDVTLRCECDKERNYCDDYIHWVLGA